MRRPWVMTGSDASAGHPRFYGSFARKYAQYVLADRVLTLRQFIERSSTLAADTFRLDGRGRLKPGAFADVVVFDPKLYAARATYEQPTLPAVGVRQVVVNGVLAVDDGALTGKAAGRGLRHVPPPGTCP
jgi:N-acyl-D-amino-acid deacylase